MLIADLILIFTGSYLPDIIIGIIIAIIVSIGGIKIIRLSLMPASSIEDDCCYILS